MGEVDFDQGTENCHPLVNVQKFQTLKNGTPLIYSFNTSELGEEAYFAEGDHSCSSLMKVLSYPF